MTENELQPAQLLVAEALVSGEGVTSSATLAGVSRQSVYRWLNDDADFVAHLARLKNEQLEAARNRVRLGAVRAAAVIADLMENSQSDAVRLQAAKELLSASGALNSIGSSFDDDPNSIKATQKSNAMMNESFAKLVL